MSRRRASRRRVGSGRVRPTYPSRKAQLEAINRRLLRTAGILIPGAALYELLASPGFSWQRFSLMVGAVVLGLLFGRTVGRIMFLTRRHPRRHR